MCFAGAAAAPGGYGIGTQSGNQPPPAVGSQAPAPVAAVQTAPSARPAVAAPSAPAAQPEAQKPYLYPSADVRASVLDTAETAMQPSGRAGGDARLDVDTRDRVTGLPRKRARQNLLDYGRD